MPKIAYNLVFNELKRKIEGRLILPGDNMPSENSLASQYQISRTTARKVLQLLADRGLIVSRAGIGWQVLPETPGLQRPRKHWTIGIDSPVTDWGYYYHKHLLAGMQSAAHELQCSLNVVCGPEHGGENFAPQVDALVLMLPNPEYYAGYCALAAQGMPVCFINRRPPGADISVFCVDYAAEARRAVEYLLLTGHRDIALVGGGYTPSMNERENGYFQAFAARGLSVPLHLIMHDFDIAQQTELLAKHKPSAAFLLFGNAASNFILAAERARMRIPDDISLICFDDMSDNPIVDVPLSHIRMPLYNMGRDAVSHAVAMLNGDTNKNKKRLYQADLCLNSSCKYNI